ncbi:MAG TPA: L,D-transpeptidase family protein [Desulfuromonadaceae bacterium]|jgi:L,D-transpeptidase ErfK/SrfK
MAPANLILTFFVSVIILVCFDPKLTDAVLYPFTDGLIGLVQYYKVRPGESLHEIARRFDLGYNSIVDANPEISPFAPPSGAIITLPTAWILPDVPQYQGIIINLPEMQSYYFPTSGDLFIFPIGIGDQGKDTPTGSFSIIEKISNPAWYVPVSIRRERPELPKIVPPGPDNPLGSHALRLSVKNIFIHGTDKPWGVGRRSTHGCLRLYPEDMLKLVNMITARTPVTIVDQPIKAVKDKGRILVEVHRYKQVDYLEKAGQILRKKGLSGEVDMNKLKRAVKEKSGMPVDVSK